MIHGHTHRPARHSTRVDGQPRERIVLADWDEHGHYVAIDADGVHTRHVVG
jgi:UDP-2,3-diacylglucosamine hydrolase